MDFCRTTDPNYSLTSNLQVIWRRCCIHEHTKKNSRYRPITSKAYAPRGRKHHSIGKCTNAWKKTKILHMKKKKKTAPPVWKHVQNWCKSQQPLIKRACTQPTATHDTRGNCLTLSRRRSLSPNPVVGSSRNSRAGRVSSSVAIDSRRFSPPDTPRVRPPPIREFLTPKSPRSRSTYG